MKNLKHIALFLSCLVIASCTKDIDEKEPSNECSILDIQLTGQLGKATIERVDDNQGTVTLYIFEQADYPWEAVGVEALALSAYATADVSDGGTLDFRNPERKARIIVRSQTGKQVLWTVYLKPYNPFYVGTWAVSDIKIYLDQNISGNGTGKWDTSMGGSEFGLFASPELDNIITITMNEEMVDGKFTGKIINAAGADGLYGSFKGVYPGEYTEDAPLDMDPRLRHLIPAGESDWMLDLSTNQMKISKNNITSTMTFSRDTSGNLFFDFALTDASGDTPGNNFYNNFWRSSYKFSYIVRAAE